MTSRRGALFLFVFVAAGLGLTAPSAEAASAQEKNRAAWEAFQRRDFRAAEDLASEAWARAEEDKDPVQEAIGAANRAAAIAMRGRLDEALEWSRRAERVLGPDREPRVRGRILVAQALLRQVRGEEEARKQAFVRARQALGPDDWSLSFAEALAEAYDWEDMNAAYKRLNALGDTARASKEPDRMVLALLVVGWLEGVGGDLGSLKRFEEARTQLAKGSGKVVLPLIDHNVGSILLWANRLDEAQSAYERGLAEARATSNRRMEMILLDDLGMLFSQKEDWPRAIASDREAAERLAGIQEDVRQGRLDDSLLLDLRRLVKGRYVHKPQLLIEPFIGLFDQFAVEPEASTREK